MSTIFSIDTTNTNKPLVPNYGGNKELIKHITEKHHLTDSIIGKRSFFIKVLYTDFYCIGILNDDHCRIILGNNDARLDTNYVKQMNLPLTDKRVRSLFTVKEWHKYYVKSTWPIMSDYYILFGPDGNRVFDFNYLYYFYNHCKIFAKRPLKRGSLLINKLIWNYFCECYDSERGKEKQQIIPHP